MRPFHLSETNFSIFMITFPLVDILVIDDFPSIQV